MMASSSGKSWSTILVSVAVAGFAYFAIKFTQHRRFYKDLPKPPYSFFWGHLKLMGEMIALFPSSPHLQLITTTLSQKYNLPSIWYLDLWPLGPQLIVVTDPDLAMYMTAIKNHPKHSLEAIFVDPVVGKRNIVTVNGPLWKTLHNMLAPAFSTAHVKNMVGMIAEEVITFRSILHELADSGEVFSLDIISSNLAFDIIGKVTFGHSFEAQAKASLVLQNFHDICRAFSIERDAWNPVTLWIERQKRLAATKQLDDVLNMMIQDRFEVLQKGNFDVSKKRGLSIVDLVLRECLEEARKSGEGSPTALDANFLNLALTQIKTLLLAGTGTTSDTICFVYMLLSTGPEIVQKMREEHDRVFTPGIEATYSMLQENPHKLSELEYTKNVIKETLRLYPIGNTARAEDETGFLTYQGRQYSTKGHAIVPVAHTMHYDSKYFPNPMAFDPDRFTRDESPRHAWRPFERGPRACLGQELAVNELKVILLLTVREFDFTCANIKPNKVQRVAWTDMDLTFGDLAFQEFVFESKPRDGMPMTVRRAVIA